jgi:hypothetical protein
VIGLYFIIGMKEKKLVFPGMPPVYASFTNNCLIKIWKKQYTGFHNELRIGFPKFDTGRTCC